jgi:RNA polymerase sigma-70 factor (ECF subfamily)
MKQDELAGEKQSKNCVTIVMDDAFLRVGWMPERQQVDETSLLQQAIQGDTEAFGQIYEVYAPLVFRFLFAHLDNRLDAEDLTEEVFLRTWQSLPNYRMRGVPFTGFLFRVARNALYDHYRRSRNRNADPGLDQELVDDLQPDPALSVPLHLERRELRQTLAKLREDYRTVLVLRFLVGLSPDETAQAMSRSSGAIRVLQHRALAAARKLLLKQESEL